MNLLSLFNPKAKLGIEGRKQSISIIKKNILPADKVIWMHVSSLGEYEQGLPVLEALKNQYPQHKILVSFFSPSGYEVVVKKKHFADAMFYLPFDTPTEIDELVSLFKTDIFITVKYDYWFHLLRALKNQGAKIYVVSALFYEGQVFFKPWGKWMVRQLRKNIDWFFHQTKASTVLAKSIKINQSSTAGDTRFDRVKQLRDRNHFVEGISEFKGAQKLIIFGSAWHSEEKIAQLLQRKLPKTKLIIAPHDLDRVTHIQEIFKDKAILYSDAVNDLYSLPYKQVLIIDSIGLLSRLYSYGDVAVVGGGFHSAGLHNVLEPATFGLPVMFGNQYQKNPEADELIKVNGGKSFDSEIVAVDFLQQLIKDEDRLLQMSKNAENFVSSQPNSTKIIMEKIRRESPNL